MKDYYTKASKLQTTIDSLPWYAFIRRFKLRAEKNLEIMKANDYTWWLTRKQDIINEFHELNSCTCKCYTCKKDKLENLKQRLNHATNMIKYYEN